MNSVFSSTAKGPQWLWQQLVPADLIGTIRMVPIAFIWPKFSYSRDGAAEKHLWVKNHDVLPLSLGDAYNSSKGEASPDKQVFFIV